MSCSNISGAACAGAGAFALGAGFTGAFLLSIPFDATPIIIGAFASGIGVYFAGTALTARATDEIFKKMGWEDLPVTRMLVSHTIVVIASSAILSMLWGELAIIGLISIPVLFAGTLCINLLMNDLLKNDLNKPNERSFYVLR